MFKEYIFVQKRENNDTIEQFVRELNQALESKNKMLSMNNESVVDSMEAMKSNGSGSIAIKIISRGIFSKFRARISSIRHHGNQPAISKQSSGLFSFTRPSTVLSEDNNQITEFNSARHSVEESEEIVQSEENVQSEQENETRVTFRETIERQSDIQARYDTSLNEREEATKENVRRRTTRHHNTEIPIIPWSKPTEEEINTLDDLRNKHDRLCRDMTDLQAVYTRATWKITKTNEKYSALKKKKGYESVTTASSESKRPKESESKRTTTDFGGKQTFAELTEKYKALKERYNKAEKDRTNLKKTNLELKAYKEVMDDLDVKFKRRKGEKYELLEKKLDNLKYAQYHQQIQPQPLMIQVPQPMQYQTFQPQQPFVYVQQQPVMQPNYIQPMQQKAIPQLAAQSKFFGRQNEKDSEDTEWTSLTSHYTEIAPFDDESNLDAMNEKKYRVRFDMFEQKEEERLDRPVSNLTKDLQAKIRRMQEEITDLHNNAYQAIKGELSDLVTIIGENREFENVKIFANENSVKIGSDEFQYDDIFKLIRCKEQKKKWILVTSTYQIQILASSEKARDDFVLFIHDILYDMLFRNAKLTS